jgi:hypothetical protein
MAQDKEKQGRRCRAVHFGKAVSADDHFVFHAV